MRSVLVGGEIALALLLLIGSCLLIRTVYLLDHQELGFSHDHLLTAGIVLDKARYADPTRQNQFARDAVMQLGQIPGVQSASIASDLPAAGANSVVIHIKGQPESRSNEQHSALDVVAVPNYFDLIGVPLLHGRTFTNSDDAAAPRVIVVNQQFVQKYFPDRDPIGKQVQLDTPNAAPAWSQIVGVVSDVRSFSEDPRIEPEVYEAFAQRPVASFSVILRSRVEPDNLVSALRHVIGQLDPELPLLRVLSMDGVIDVQRTGNPFFTRLLGAFAFLALVLSAIGIYGLIAYSVSQREHEIGIRMALGAKTSDISRMILREGFKVAVIGSVIGFVLALPLPTLFNSMFQGALKFGAPIVYPLVLGAMLIVVFVAVLGPARRATRIDPTAALRNE